MSVLKNKKGGVSALFCLIWSSPIVAFGVNSVLLGYVTYYSTNVLGLPIILVGNLLLISKIFDGITDLISGLLIERTKTKIGKARPYDFAYPLYCIFTILLFSIPVMSMSATAAAVFVLYTIIFSVFQTLFSTAGIVYLGRVVTNNDDRIKVISIQGVLLMFASTIIGVLVPQMIEAAGTARAEWSKMAILICIPCAIVSMIRFFVVKETHDSSEKAGVNINLKESVYLLTHNKPLIFYSLALLLTNISGNLNQVGTYYFQYIVKDIGAMSIMSLGILGSVFFIPFFPVLVKKFGMTKFIIGTLIVGAIGKMLPVIDNTNIVILFISSLISGISFMPLWQLAASALLDCADYGEWSLGIRGEGTCACISGLCSKLGTGVGAWAVGFTMALGGFDAQLAVQGDPAILSMKLLYMHIPTILIVIAILFMTRYKIDKMMPTIREELALKRSANA